LRVACKADFPICLGPRTCSNLGRQENLPYIHLKTDLYIRAGNSQRRNLGQLHYCKDRRAGSGLHESSAKQKGKMEARHLISNLNLRAKPMSKEYGHRFCCEEGFRDAK